jgi:exo-poly-alpha-galacturonosidase
MKKVVILCASCVVLFTITAFIPAAKKQTRFLITDYGAKGDSVTLNTQFIQAAINDCAVKGGGVVVIPKGIFISGAIFLKNKVNLYVEKEGVLKGSANQVDYQQINTRWEGEERVWTSAFINAIDLDGTQISGDGTIDGSGDVWLKNNNLNKGIIPDGPRLGRPRMICFQNCKNVKIEHLKLHNQAVWCLHILYCTNVVINDLHITADHNIPSSDGIDIDSSSQTKVTGCFIDVNDDCISIKSGKDEDGLRINRPSQDITITDCHFAYGHGGVAMGSETSGGIKNVLVKDCLIDSQNWEPIRFKSQPSRGGVVENITYENIQLHNTRKAFEFNMAWRMVGKIKPPSAVPPVVKNILIKNVTGDVNAVGEMLGLDNSPIQGVKFVNCNIKAQTGFIMRNVINIDTAGLKLQVAAGKSIIK